MKKYIIMVWLFLLSGCATIRPSEQTSVTRWQNCPAERPQICTKEYRPVCALKDTETRCVTTPCPSSEEKTYSNACSACADEKVLGYRRGSCSAQ